MFIHPRRHRGSREPQFRSPALRRERVLSLYAFAAVKLALAVALAIAASEAFNMFRVHAGDVPLSWRLALPFLFAAGALLVLRLALQSVRDARREASAPTETETPPEEAEE